MGLTILTTSKPPALLPEYCNSSSTSILAPVFASSWISLVVKWFFSLLMEVSSGYSTAQNPPMSSLFLLSRCQRPLSDHKYLSSHYLSDLIFYFSVPPLLCSSHTSVPVDLQACQRLCTGYAVLPALPFLYILENSIINTSPPSSVTWTPLK